MRRGEEYCGHEPIGSCRALYVLVGYLDYIVVRDDTLFGIKFVTEKNEYRIRYLLPLPTSKNKKGATTTTSHTFSFRVTESVRRNTMEHL